ncbi:MamK family actin-like protein [Magnetospira sp. QH-2]|uniref:MamK family actin-like protein n=1 Tax=Magnetospira sp. (strain QH-2) TaxID=1288970 RepID=UPI0003E81B83|nr:MamK family actin-like protein [Magnetospira sp. QH-2]CCQ72992.1 actin-like protein MamK [Magnetospira sp. QH-2]
MNADNDGLVIDMAADTAPAPKTKKRLRLGIDLGTSHTAIMSDRGAKAMVSSVVGYPKDIVGVKLLGAPYVVGDRAIATRSYLELRYPLEDGVIRELGDRDMEVARHLFKHVLALSKPEEGDEVCAIIGVPARASNANKELLLGLAREVVQTAMVVSEPFMVAFGQGKLVNSLVIDIGAGTIDICALKGMVPAPEDQITIPKAGNFVDERLQVAIIDLYPDVQINAHVARAIKEAHSFVGKAASPIKANLRVDGKPVERDVTAAIQAACESILPDVLEGIETLIRNFPPEDQATVLKNIIVAGGGSRIAGLETYIKNHLSDYGEVEVTCVQDPDYDGAGGALKLAQELPPEYWGQLGDMVSG